MSESHEPSLPSIPADDPNLQGFELALRLAQQGREALSDDENQTLGVFLVRYRLEQVSGEVAEAVRELLAGNEPHVDEVVEILVDQDVFEAESPPKNIFEALRKWVRRRLSWRQLLARGLWGDPKDPKESK